MRTVLAAFNMTAKRGSTTDLDRRHDVSLGEVQVTSVGRAPRLTVAAEDIGHIGPINHLQRSDLPSEIASYISGSVQEPGIDGLARTSLRFS